VDARELERLARRARRAARARRLQEERRQRRRRLASLLLLLLLLIGAVGGLAYFGARHGGLIAWLIEPRSDGTRLLDAVGDSLAAADAPAEVRHEEQRGLACWLSDPGSLTLAELQPHGDAPGSFDVALVEPEAGGGKPDLASAQPGDDAGPTPPKGHKDIVENPPWDPEIPPLIPTAGKPGGGPIVGGKKTPPNDPPDDSHVPTIDPPKPFLPGPFVPTGGGDPGHKKDDPADKKDGKDGDKGNGDKGGGDQPNNPQHADNPSDPGDPPIQTIDGPGGGDPSGHDPSGHDPSNPDPNITAITEPGTISLLALSSAVLLMLRRRLSRRERIR
jgi:hypothetical protein